jgi:drug/metabolite transporter (DMT)-like permease
MDAARRVPVAEIGLVAIAAVWGLTFVMVQDAVERIPVMTFLAYRFIPASALVALGFRKQLRSLGPAGWRAGIWMGLFLTGGYVFQTLGLQHTSAANAGFITGLWVVLTPVFGALMFGQRAGRAVWIAAGTSAVGLFLLSGIGGGEVHLLGDALVLVCAVSFTFHIFATDKGVKDHAVGALVVVQLGVCGTIALVAAAAMGDLQLPRSAPVWSALAVTSLLASALGFFIQTYAQQHASPARTALILASEPAFAGLFAYVLAGETLRPLGWLGAALILGAIVTVEALPHLRRARPVPQLDQPLPEFD